MNCPYCGSSQTRVAETRDVMNGSQKRRYRKCMSCGDRFVTYEKVEEKMSPRDKYGLIERLNKYHKGATMDFPDDIKNILDAYHKGVIAQIVDETEEELRL